MKKGEISNDKTGISQQVDCSRGLRGTALTVKTGDWGQQTEHRWGQELGLRNNSDSDPDLII